MSNVIYNDFDFKHEVNINTITDTNYIPVPQNDVLKGSWSGGLVVRHNRQKMTLTAKICKTRYFDHITTPATHTEPKSMTIGELPVNFYLDKPIWNGGDYLLGIATWRLKQKDLLVFCNYQTKSGNPLWNGGLLLTKGFASNYPIKHYKNGKLELYEIPLQELKDFNNNGYDTKKGRANTILFEWLPEN